MKWIESQHSEGLLWKVCCVFLQVFVRDILRSDGEWCQTGTKASDSVFDLFPQQVPSVIGK